MKNLLVFLVLIQSSLVFGCVFELELASKDLVATLDTGPGPFFPGIEVFEKATPDLTQQGKARGEVLEVMGRLTSLSMKRYKDLQILVWQVDSEGKYPQTWGADPGFSYYGKAILTKDGNFTFRTIRPIPYGPRSSHIHLAVVSNKQVVLFTEIHFAADQSQANDRFIQSLDPKSTLFTEVHPPQLVRFRYFHIYPEIVLP